MRGKRPFCPLARSCKSPLYPCVWIPDGSPGLEVSQGSSGLCSRVAAFTCIALQVVIVYGKGGFSAPFPRIVFSWRPFGTPSEGCAEEVRTEGEWGAPEIPLSFIVRHLMAGLHWRGSITPSKGAHLWGSPVQGSVKDHPLGLFSGRVELAFIRWALCKRGSDPFPQQPPTHSFIS